MMLDKMRAWIDSRGHEKQEILHRVTSNNVRTGNNKRIGDQSLATGHVSTACYLKEVCSRFLRSTTCTWYVNA